VRKADPCSLLDVKQLARFGNSKIDPNYGEFGRCDVLVYKRHTSIEIVDVNLNFDNDPGDGAPFPTKTVDHVTIIEPPGDAEACVRNVQLSDGNEISIEAELIGPAAPDLCAIAQAATDYAVRMLNSGPVPERPEPFPVNSLARLDACDLLDHEALKVIPGIDADVKAPGFANWGCDWESASQDAGVTLLFNQDNDLTGDGVPARLGGRQSYVAPNEWGDHSCLVSIEHRSYTDAAGESTVEHIQLNAYGPQLEGKLCDIAKELATAVTRNLAKP
jgi:hypothetical protein